MNKKEGRREIKKINTELIPLFFWRCPICKKEDTLVIKKERKKGFISKLALKCVSCGATWKDVCPRGMTLVEGPESLLGPKTMEGWGKLMYAEKLNIEVKDIPVPILLKKNEKPVKKGYATLYQEKTKKVRLGGSLYGGLSVPLIKTSRGPIRLHTGTLRTPAMYETISEMSKIDGGDFILTTQRVVFKGRQKSINMDLKKLIFIEVENLMLKMGYGQKVYFFNFGKDSPFKWQAYVSGVYHSQSI